MAERHVVHLTSLAHGASVWSGVPELILDGRGRRGTTLAAARAREGQLLATVFERVPVSYLAFDRPPQLPVHLFEVPPVAMLPTSI